ncbi:MAG: BON domain-containing protein [Betaproteobacteria bacterium]|nr:BON domain-containing protein [Betaproteobacteria bacterium]
MNCKHMGYRAVALALVASWIAAAAAAGASEMDGQFNREFRKLDANRDGYVTEEEARKVRGFDRALREADDNRDGRLDADEFVKAQAVHGRMLAGQYVEDSVITTRIKAALLKDPVVSGLAVSVETHKGTVLLSGFVDNENQARRAAEIAAGVRGVTTVKSALAVKS